MSKPKLIYFDAPVSRGEECRLAFAVAGIDFEDVRLKREDWAALKPTSPFGCVPILEIPGKQPLGQSNAILAFLGRAYGMHPRDAFEGARHEAMMEHVEDLRHKLTPSLSIQDEAEKKKAREALVAGYIPQWAAATERQIGEGPFFAGAKISVVDLKLHMVVRWLASGKVDYIPADIFAAYPKLNKLHDAVGEHDAVKAWRAKSS